MDEPTQEQPKKRRGWPKGVPRGPRKPKEALTAPPPAPATPVPQAVPTAVYEPVKVDIVYKTGQVVQFSASTFEFTPTEYKFWSYPEQRGFKQLHVIQKSEVIALSVTAPERDFLNLSQQPVAPPPPPPSAAAGVYPAPDPYAAVGGDPQVSIAPRGRSRVVGQAENKASLIPTAGLPRSAVVQYDKGELVERTTDAAMI